jgi:uncharacterized protein (TIGR02118 family)
MQFSASDKGAEMDTTRGAEKIDRRSAMVIGASAAASMLVTGPSAKAQADAGVKMTVLYGQPKSTEEFDDYYLKKHVPMAAAVNGIKRMELSKVLPPPDGSPPTYFRVAEIYFDSLEQMKSVRSSPEWKKVVDDTKNFVTGTVTLLVSKIEA